MSLLQEILTEAYDHHPGNVENLVTYADNTKKLHNKGVAIRAGHQKFMDSKSYDKDKAFGQWYNFANEVSKAYAKEIEGDASTWNSMFSVSDRKRAAKVLADMFNKTHEEQEEYIDMDYEQEEVGITDHKMDYKMPHDMDDDYDDGSHLDVDHDYDASKEVSKEPKEMDKDMANAFIRGGFRK